MYIPPHMQHLTEMTEEEARARVEAILARKRATADAVETPAASAIQEAPTVDAAQGASNPAEETEQQTIDRPADVVDDVEAAVAPPSQEPTQAPQEPPDDGMSHGDQQESGEDLEAQDGCVIEDTEEDEDIIFEQDDPDTGSRKSQDDKTVAEGEAASVSIPVAEIAAGNLARYMTFPLFPLDSGQVNAELPNVSPPQPDAFHDNDFTSYVQRYARSASSQECEDPAKHGGGKDDASPPASGQAEKQGDRTPPEATTDSSGTTPIDANPTATFVREVAYKLVDEETELPKQQRWELVKEALDRLLGDTHLNDLAVGDCARQLHASASVEYSAWVNWQVDRGLILHVAAHPSPWRIALNLGMIIRPVFAEELGIATAHEKSLLDVAIGALVDYAGATAEVKVARMSGKLLSLKQVVLLNKISATAENHRKLFVTTLDKLRRRKPSPVLKVSGVAMLNVQDGRGEPSRPSPER